MLGSAGCGGIKLGSLFGHHLSGTMIVDAKTRRKKDEEW